MAKQKLEIRQGWKVLDRGQSSNVGHLQYHAGKWTYPEKDAGPLCVFAKEEDAYNFALVHGTVHACLFVKSPLRYVWHPDRGGYEVKEYMRFLSKGKILASCVLVLSRCDANICPDKFPVQPKVTKTKGAK